MCISLNSNFKKVITTYALISFKKPKANEPDVALSLAVHANIRALPLGKRSYFTCICDISSEIDLR